LLTDQDAALHRLLDHPPLLHMNEAGELVNFQIDPKLVPHLRDAVRPGTRSMETGSGISTIVLLLLGAQHTSISPDAGEAERIRAYCEANDIPVDGFTAMVAKSEDVLPDLHLDAELDLIIVDGNHAFPAPMVDWFYMTRHLRTGGVLVVDDVELWTGAVLADFLDGEAGVWVRIERTKRFAVYRLVGDVSDALGRSWVDQPHVVKSSDLSMIGNPHVVHSSRHPGQPIVTRLQRIARRSWWKVKN
jgi:Methyltransferase domain